MTCDESEAEFGALPVTVAGDDISGLTITTGRAGTISGRVVYEAPHRARRQVS